MVNNGKPSKVYDYVTKVRGENGAVALKCNTCGKEIAKSKGNTSNMAKHLLSHGIAVPGINVAKHRKALKCGEMSEQSHKSVSRESGSIATDFRPTTSASAAEEVKMQSDEKVQEDEDCSVHVQQLSLEHNTPLVDPLPFHLKTVVPTTVEELTTDSGEPNFDILSMTTQFGEVGPARFQQRDAKRDSPKLAQVVDGDTTEVCTANPTPNTSDQRVEEEESSFLDKQEVMTSNSSEAVVSERSLLAEDAEVYNHGVEDIEELSSPYSQQPSYADGPDLPTVGAEAMDEVARVLVSLLEPMLESLHTDERVLNFINQLVGWNPVEDVQLPVVVEPPDFTHSSGMVEACDGLSELSLSDDMDLDSDDDNILREAAP